jgi:hypothetical protein
LEGSRSYQRDTQPFAAIMVYPTLDYKSSIATERREYVDESKGVRRNRTRRYNSRIQRVVNDQ